MIRRVLVVGGVDPSGGAGISADARVLQAHGVHALPVVVALTVQNRFGMRQLDAVPAEHWRPALAAAIQDGPLHAVKTGLLADGAQAQALAEDLQRLLPDVPLVVDPVLSATAGGYRAGAGLARALRAHLAPRCALLTPNAPELEALLAGDGIEALLEAGCGAVLCKGGHDAGDTVTDRLVSAAGTHEFVHARQPVGPVHGTGCALASAIAARLAHGAPLLEACATGIAWLQRCLGVMGPADASGRPRPLPVVSGTSSR